ncbi:PAS domain-containing sensor histidine kinase [Roseivirga sp.]|uniref:PAS domain-containing sensor histidine kinase n=1 Tax=Roseivirga sp. TaxID=1964215 RepID=UPI003B518B8C
MQQFLEEGYLFDIIYRNSVEGILVTDAKGTIVHCNPSCEQIFGYLKDEIVGQSVEILIPEDQREKHLAHRSAYISNPQSRQMGLNLELMGLTKKGGLVPLEISLSHADSRKGLIIICFIIDVSKRRALQSELEKEKAMIRQYMNVTTSLFLVINREEKIVLANNALGDLLGLSVQELKGRNWFDEFLPKAEKENMRQMFKDLFEKGVLVSDTFENEIVCHNGRKCLIEWHNTLLKNDAGQYEATLSSGIDITERRALEKARTEALLLGQENERQRIARELHDGLGQSISAINLNLNAFEPELQKFNNKVQSIYSNLKNNLNETMEEIRTISHNLTPRILEDFGLGKALENIIESLGQPDGVIFNLSLHGNLVNLDKGFALAVYRIVQELVNNALKHADPTEINIHVVRSKEELNLLVEDNGKGFLHSQQSMGLGLSNVKSRVDILKGTLHIDSNDKSGTSVSICIPL